MHKILIVEDESHLARGLKFNIEREKIRADIVETAEKAFPIFAKYDMMILDVILPGKDGIELLKEIRRIDFKYPVLILSAKASEKDLVDGLAAGADDYMTKPFSLEEFILRVKRILQRQSWLAKISPEGTVYRFGDYWIDFESFEAMTNSGETRLTHYECCVMKYLIEKKGRAVSRGELLEHVWGYDREMDTRTVDIFIGRLRNMFERDRKKPKYLRSIRGVGYRFFDDSKKSRS